MPVRLVVLGQHAYSGEPVLGDSVPPLPVGSDVGGYQVEGILGHGGFGITYRARHRVRRTIVALKEFAPRGLVSREIGCVAIQGRPDATATDLILGIQEFQREAETLMHFRHPNVVSVLAFFEAHGTAYIAMRFINGESLSAVRKRSGSIPRTALNDLFEPILDGLEHVHSRSIYHLDLKPANIVISDSGAPVLVDFGAAENAARPLGLDMAVQVTPPYAPIEQYRSGQDVGPWTDIHALAVTAGVLVGLPHPPEALARQKDVIAGKPDPLLAWASKASAEYGKVVAEAIAWGGALRPQDRPGTISDWRRCLLGEIRPPIRFETKRSGFTWPWRR